MIGTRSFLFIFIFAYRIPRNCRRKYQSHRAWPIGTRWRRTFHQWPGCVIVSNLNRFWFHSHGKQNKQTKSLILLITSSQVIIDFLNHMFVTLCLWLFHFINHLVVNILIRIFLLWKNYLISYWALLRFLASSILLHFLSSQMIPLVLW